MSHAQRSESKGKADAERIRWATEGGQVHLKSRDQREKKHLMRAVNNALKIPEKDQGGPPVRRTWRFNEGAILSEKDRTTVRSSTKPWQSTAVHNAWTEPSFYLRDTLVRS